MTNNKRPSLFRKAVLLAALVSVQSVVGQGTSAGAGGAITKKLSSIEVEVVRLTPEGFSPSAISRRKGPFLLVIRNYDRRGDIVFDGAPGDLAMLPATILKDQDRWSGLADLALGDHLLIDHEKPARQLKITLK